MGFKKEVSWRGSVIVVGRETLIPAKAGLMLLYHLPLDSGGVGKAQVRVYCVSRKCQDDLGFPADRPWHAIYPP